MNLSWKRFLSLLLALTMLLSLGVTGFADEGNTEEETPVGEEIPAPETEETTEDDEIRALEMESLNPDKLGIAKLGRDGSMDEEELVSMDEEDLNTPVRVSIFLEEPSALAAGYAPESAGSYRDALRVQQDALTARIESLLGRQLNVHWNLTLIVNAISTELSPAEMVKVQAMDGVRSVQRENQYLPMDDDTAQPNTANTSENMVGAAAAWTAGYTGAGSRIAIIDTGLDTGHQSFVEVPFNHAIELVRASGKTVNLMTSVPSSGLNGSGKYLNAKVPYIYNYVDKNTDVTHLNDTQGEHGSHVAGIAAANRFIGSDYKDAATEVDAVGMAPDAQLLIMKVFGKGGGANDSDYMAAIEDAMVLGCDVANLSLGSAVQGWTYDNNYQDELNGWTNTQHNTKMVLSISAGNAYDLALMTTEKNLYIEDVSMHTGGSPGSFVNSLCVAAAQNTLTKGTPMLFNGSQDVFYYESTGDEEEGTTYTNPALTTIKGSYTYVYIDADYSTVNNALSLSGKVVIVNRGDISFVEKGENAKSFNPKALIVANNSDGTIYMNLSDFTGTFPMVTITKKDAEGIKLGGTEHTAGGITYYTGSVAVTDVQKEVTIDRSAATITDFSSWGVPGSLIMKPEITAPGGDINSVNGTHAVSNGTAGGTDQYELMSGTSMAAPHITGLTAVLAQYLRENPVSNKNSALAGAYSTRAIAQSLMMSTATPMAPENEYLSILQQGAGLVEVSKAINTQSVIMMDSSRSYLTGKTGAAADGKVKAELGDDPERKGQYEIGFSIYNLHDVDMEVTLDADVFTQASDEVHMLRGTAIIPGAYVSFSWDGQSAGPANDHDVNKDGVTNAADAQAILDYLSGKIEDAGLDLEAGEMDGDKELTTKDAYLLLGYAPAESEDENKAIVPANGVLNVTAVINLPDGAKEWLDGNYPCGAYVEAFLYVDGVAATKDGGTYTDEHSIPVLGFYGSWTDPSMFETTSYAEELYGNNQNPYSGNSDTNYLLLTMNGANTKFSGNPYMVEGSAVTDFPANRLAINSSSNMVRISYNLIRAAATTGFAVSRLEAGEPDETGETQYTIPEGGVLHRHRQRGGRPVLQRKKRLAEHHHQGLRHQQDPGRLWPAGRRPLPHWLLCHPRVLRHAVQ